MLGVTRIAAVKDKVQLGQAEEVPQLKIVVIRFQSNSCNEKGRAIRDKPIDKSVEMNTA